MEQTFRALDSVISELARFVFHEWLGFRETGRLQSAFIFSSSPAVRAETKQPLDHLVPVSGTVIVRSRGARLYHEPVQYFDGVVATVPYGTTLSLIGRSERWYHVASTLHTGWVLHDEVLDCHEGTRFLIGAMYDAMHSTTELVRARIGDEFSGSMLGVPLQDVEYVLYRLIEEGKRVVWPSVRPRIAGSWQRILKGGAGIHMTVIPQRGAVMELLYEDGTGHLAFVDEVYPDESILVSEVGFPEEGNYNERVLPKDEWREFRPIFIEIA